MFLTGQVKNKQAEEGRGGGGRKLVRQTLHLATLTLPLAVAQLVIASRALPQVLAPLGRPPTLNHIRSSVRASVCASLCACVCQ